MRNQPLKLLHVENDETEAEIFQRLIAKEFGVEGCKVTQADTLRRALDILQESEFNAILLDLDLNDIQGLDTVKAVRFENPELPIVVLSGHDNNDIALNAVRNGAQEYMVKGHSNSRMLGLALLSSIERKAYERHLFYLANHDELTDLPNIRMFNEHLKRWMVRARRWDHSECVLFLDMDNFKQINDQYGHDFGNMTLQAVAERLSHGLRSSDMLARYAGDEFVIHLDMEAGESREACVEVAQKIHELFSTPLLVDGIEVETGVSIGIAFYPDHGQDPKNLIASADKAMYLARKQGRPYAFASKDWDGSQGPSPLSEAS